MTTTITWLSPEDAAQLLAANTNNRSISKSQVSRMAQDILEDNWDFNGDTIRVGANGALMDGQHRLSAIVEANEPLPVILVTGLDPAAVESIDQGRARSVPAILQFLNQEVRNASICASMAMVLMQGAGGSPNRAPSRPAIADFIIENKGEVERWAEWAKRIASVSPLTQVRVSRRVDKKKRIMSPSPLAALAMWMTQTGGANEASVVEFFESVATGLVTDPAQLAVVGALRARFTNTVPLSRDGGSSFYALLAEYDLTIRAYNMYVDRVQARRLVGTSRQVTSFASLTRVRTNA